MLYKIHIYEIYDIYPLIIRLKRKNENTKRRKTINNI